MAISAATQSSPMDEINMTPLIDVMLVLLVMFIITIPIQTHAVKFDLPQDCPGLPDRRPFEEQNRGHQWWRGAVERDADRKGRAGL